MDIITRLTCGYSVNELTDQEMRSVVQFLLKAVDATEQELIKLGLINGE